MLNSESCKNILSSLGEAEMSRVRQIAGNVSGQAEPGSEEAKKLCQEFAAVLYGLLFREMQQTVPREEDESALSGGVRGFLSTHLPQAVAGGTNDPLMSYVNDAIGTLSGDQINEEI